MPLDSGNSSGQAEGMQLWATAPDGSRHHARREGAGPVPVLLVHGFPFDHRQWEPQLEALRRTAAMLAPDLRGLGASGGARGPGSARLSDYADDLARWLDHIGWERTIVTGLSMGGYIAFEFVRRHPERVLGLVLADTSPAADTEEVIADRLATSERVAVEGMGAVVEGLLTRVPGPTTQRSRPEVRARLLRMVSEAPITGVRAALEAMAGRPDSTPTLGSITVPTLVVVGEEDVLTPPARAEAMAAGIAGARLVVIPRAGHVPPLETPEAFNRAMGEFLAGVLP
jgi:3-oxoadipate enol-lactonase